MNLRRVAVFLDYLCDSFGLCQCKAIEKAKYSAIISITEIH